MPNLKIDIDVSSIAEMANDLKSDLEAELKRGVKLLAAQTHAHVKELAAQELHSSLGDFQKSVGFEEIEKGVWVISISQDGLWIEEGLPQDFDMKPGLLKRKAKTSKDGYLYRVVPFNHQSKGDKNDYGKNVIARIQSELKQRRIPIKKLEMNQDGTPKLGRLHSFNFDSEHPSAKASNAVLDGVTIYQTKDKASGKVRRDIMTFRTVSSNPAVADKWKHPGYAAKKFLDRSAEWAERTWESEILPQILDKYKKGT